MDMHPGRIVIVTAGGENPSVMIDALSRRFSDIVVLQEPPESKALFLKRRARKLGWISALGQLGTMIVSRFGKRFTRARAAEILAAYGASTERASAIRTIPIPAINTPEALAAVMAEQPAVIFLISCRMLSAQALAEMPCPVLNFHAGINPRYRGLMGGYWARVMKDEANFGSTVHLVDPGVDTGAILYRKRLTPSKRDTLHTYPLLQTAGATDIAVRAIDDILAGRAKPVTVDEPSRQWYHPTLWTWLRHGISRGIW
ncbi:Formyl transferase [Rhizobium sp. RU20A]|uniref:formyl transferase n=1 Tax=Rhizobium sp. RU20A TaxID=1907412 RepID=UPI000955D861|nr:formyl transferase [Rhizobium sp. RU20A]SIQ16586.1 Formyl transferase [Rhizobium sp. RU20A]